MAKQIKSRKRVADFGEVYTNKREVNAMLDLVSEQAKNITATFLEPACGNGNFLTEILERKLNTVYKLRVSRDEKVLNILRAVASVYGVDIQNDNVVEARARLKEMAVTTYRRFRGPTAISLFEFEEMLDEILSLNILCGNTLTTKMDDGSEIRFSEWIVVNPQLVIRDEVMFEDMLNGLDDEPEKHTVFEYQITSNTEGVA